MTRGVCRIGCSALIFIFQKLVLLCLFFLCVSIYVCASARFAKRNPQPSRRRGRRCESCVGRRGRVWLGKQMTPAAHSGNAGMPLLDKIKIMRAPKPDRTLLGRGRGAILRQPNRTLLGRGKRGAILGQPKRTLLGRGGANGKTSTRTGRRFSERSLRRQWKTRSKISTRCWIPATCR
jgi:hypothetical protein